MVSSLEKKPRTKVFFDLASETKESKRIIIELLVGDVCAAIMRRTTLFQRRRSTSRIWWWGQMVYIIKTAPSSIFERTSLSALEP